MNETPDQARNENPTSANPPAAAPPSAAPAPPQAAEAGTKNARAIAVKARLAPQAVEQLPPFRVLLHNDDHNDMMFVVRSIVELTPLNAPLARDVMMTAQEAGVAQVLLTHRERAELYQEQFASKGLVVTIEPAA